MVKFTVLLLSALLLTGIEAVAQSDRSNDESGDESGIVGATIEAFHASQSAEPRIEAPAQAPERFGLLTVDNAKKTVKLTLAPEECPEGQVCAGPVAAQWTMELPIVNVSRDRCGKKIIKAADQDEEIGRIEVTVHDNSDFRCPYLMHLPATSIQLRNFKAGQATRNASFIGDKLEPLN